MNDNEVKNAFDHIEPESGAQERMYANIMIKILIIPKTLEIQAHSQDFRLILLPIYYF